MAWNYRETAEPLWLLSAAFRRPFRLTLLRLKADAGKGVLQISFAIPYRSLTPPKGRWR
ncbi:hypothetical protein BQ8794_320060 [Mesorhizobium prunaredense]|uniref:Uncharacterized protein n=1 Tax=Mesorhizobium prunaredense TaxID=1631249 RepID=A0A1R3VBI7_9HYPH|nr:hypothetical protein BQ8794_320060 [Mesorhizobium prunaredense]